MYNSMYVCVCVCVHMHVRACLETAAFLELHNVLVTWICLWPSADQKDPKGVQTVVVRISMLISLDSKLNAFLK